MGHRAVPLSCPCAGSANAITKVLSRRTSYLSTYLCTCVLESACKYVPKLLVSHPSDTGAGHAAGRAYVPYRPESIPALLLPPCAQQPRRSSRLRHRCPLFFVLLHVRPCSHPLMPHAICCTSADCPWLLRRSWLCSALLLVGSRLLSATMTTRQTSDA